MENALARMAPSARSVGRGPTRDSTFTRRLKLWGKVSFTPLAEGRKKFLRASERCLQALDKRKALGQRRKKAITYFPDKELSPMSILLYSPTFDQQTMT